MQRESVFGGVPAAAVVSPFLFALRAPAEPGQRLATVAFSREFVAARRATVAEDTGNRRRQSEPIVVVVPSRVAEVA